MQNSEIPSSEVWSISGNFGKEGIPNLVQGSLIKCCQMFQNGRVTAFTVSELSPPPRLGLKKIDDLTFGYWISTFYKTSVKIFEVYQILDAMLG